MSVPLAPLNSAVRATWGAETKILLHLRRNPQGATCEALQTSLGLTPKAIQDAVRALLKRKLIFDSGEVRKTTRGLRPVYARDQGPLGKRPKWQINHKFGPND